MDGVMVTRVIPVETREVWRVFADPCARAAQRDIADVEPVTPCSPGELTPGQRWRETRTAASGAEITEELVVVRVDEGRSVTMALAGSAGSGQLTYSFRPTVAGGAPATVVTVSTQRHRYGFANRLLGFFVGGFAARTAEGALRGELDALAEACLAHAFA
jgi:hypothetical protein